MYINNLSLRVLSLQRCFFIDCPSTWSGHVKSSRTRNVTWSATIGCFLPAVLSDWPTFVLHLLVGFMFASGLGVAHWTSKCMEVRVNLLCVIIWDIRWSRKFLQFYTKYYVEGSGFLLNCHTSMLCMYSWVRRKYKFFKPFYFYYFNSEFYHYL